MNTIVIATETLRLWRGNAARLQHGVCEGCGAGGQVARQERSRKFQCIGCFALNPTGSTDVRRRVRSAQREATRLAKAAA